MHSSILHGDWTYRSFLNSTQPIGDDAAKALGLIFGEGLLTFRPVRDSIFHAILEFGGGYAMDLYGEVLHGSGVSPEMLIITGTGREGTSTAKWVYQYKGFVVPQWAEGVNQVPTIVGTVIRTISHDKGAAGVVASFVMLKR